MEAPAPEPPAAPPPPPAAADAEKPKDHQSWARPPDFDALSRYGWRWRPSDTVDENYVDLVSLVSRNSTCADGHIGCALVRGIARGGGGERRETAVGDVVLTTINSPLFGALRSDCHAEANAVAEAAARGISLRGNGDDATTVTSCYVTRAQCLSCYKLLASAGVGRIVAPRLMDSADARASAKKLDVECVACEDTEERRAHRLGLGKTHENMDEIRARREERKRLKREGKLGKKELVPIEKKRERSGRGGDDDERSE